MKEAVKEETNVQEIYKEPYSENDHIIDMTQWETLEFNIDEDYEYVPNGKIFNCFSHMLYYGVAVPVLYVLTKIIYDLKIEGKENMQNLKTGAISVSNHVLLLDCAMVGLAMDDKKVYYTTLEDSFKLPGVRKLIKLLRAIPIPKDAKNKPYFVKALDKTLQNGDIVHFYPEASLWPYYDKIRNLKTGAFRFAIKNRVPIVPMVFSFRRPNGIRRIFKKKPDVTLTVLEPIKTDIYYDNLKDKTLLNACLSQSTTNIQIKQAINELKNEVSIAMQNVLDKKKGKRKIVG